MRSARGRWLVLALSAFACGEGGGTSVHLEIPTVEGTKSALVALRDPPSNAWVALAAFDLEDRLSVPVTLVELSAVEGGPDLLVTVLLYSASLASLDLVPGPLSARTSNDPLDPGLMMADRAFRARLQGRTLSAFVAIDDDPGLRLAAAPEGESIVPMAGHAYRLTAQHSQKCLTVVDSSTSSWARVVQNPCGGGTSDVWQLVDSGAPYFALRARHSGKCAGIGGPAEDNRVRQQDCRGDAPQAWRFEPRTRRIFSVVSRDSGLCLDVVSASLVDGAHVLHYVCSSNENQQWSLTLVP